MSKLLRKSLDPNPINSSDFFSSTMSEEINVSTKDKGDDNDDDQADASSNNPTNESNVCNQPLNKSKLKYLEFSS